MDRPIHHSPGNDTHGIRSVVVITSTGISRPCDTRKPCVMHRDRTFPLGRSGSIRTTTTIRRRRRHAIQLQYSTTTVVVVMWFLTNTTCRRIQRDLTFLCILHTRARGNLETCKVCEHHGPFFDVSPFVPICMYTIHTCTPQHFHDDDDYVPWTPTPVPLHGRGDTIPHKRSGPRTIPQFSSLL